MLPGCISAKLGKRELAGDFSAPAEVSSRNLFWKKTELQSEEPPAEMKEKLAPHFKAAVTEEES